MSPCSVCENKHLDKKYPFIWLEDYGHHSRDTRNSKNRSLKHRPGKNYPNPCYDCIKRQHYDDEIRASEFCPAWPVSSHTVTRILAEDSVYDW